MDKRERVMKGLECCTHGVNKCAICPYDPRYNKIDEMNARSCMTQLAMDALELLKAQEPRLITKDDFEKADAWGTIPAWVEYNQAIEGAEPGWAIVYSGILGSPFKRAWTSRPTEEQRKSTPWEPPKEEPC